MTDNIKTRYLDSAAAAPPCPEALEAFREASGPGNPSSIHALGADAAACLERARETVAGALGCKPGEIVFTSGGTESAALAILGAVRGYPASEPPHIVVTALEHPAVAGQAARLKARGFSVSTVAPDRDGGVEAASVAAQVRENTLIVSCVTVCGENGAVLPVGEIVKAVKAVNPKTLVHTDAAQGFLRIDCHVGRTGVDLLSLSAGKIGGVCGAGALYARGGVKLNPLWGGGGQEGGLRPGTEALPSIAAMAAAVRAWKPEYNTHMRGLTEYAREALRSFAYIVTPLDCAPHILTFAPPDLPAQVAVRKLSDLGVYVSAGAACGRGRVPQALKAMRLPQGVAERAVRLSVHPGSTREDIDTLVMGLRGEPK